jgi:hypothetical protein
VGTQAKHVPKALRFFGWEMLGNNFIVQGTTLLFVYRSSFVYTYFFRLLSIFLNLVRL